MKTKIILILLLTSFIFLSAYERDQVSRYAHRYTRLTEGDSLGYNPDSLLWHNVNPFIYNLERQNNAPATLAGYIDRVDCSHFVSQCLQAGGIPMYENGYNDNALYLGCINCKNLHLFSDNFADSLGMTFHNNFWLTEVIDPVFENVHYTTTNYDMFFYVPREVELMKFHFADFHLHIGGYPPDLVTIGDYPHWNPDLVYGGDQGEFWTDHLNRYAWQHRPRVHIEYHPGWSDCYGFLMDSLRWQSEIVPDSDYATGDFQIFCNYRTGPLYTLQDSLFAIHYENTYNDTGRTIRYRHAAICRSGSGNTARVSAHSFDRNDSLWSYSYCPNSAVYNSLARNSITFYNVNINGNRPNLTGYNEWGSKAIITTSDPDSVADIDYFEAGEPVYIKYAFQNNGYLMIPDRFQVKIEYENTRTLIDSVLYDGIFSGSVVIDTLVFGMPELDSLTINVKLDKGNNEDFGDDWERTWDDQNWQEEFELDNTISKTIYLDTGLQPPTNVQVGVDAESDSLHMQWEGNSGSIYKVYSSSNPYSGFVEDLTGTYSTNSWSAPLPTENRFYYVVETDERHGCKSDILHFKNSHK